MTMQTLSSLSSSIPAAHAPVFLYQMLFVSCLGSSATFTIRRLKIQFVQNRGFVQLSLFIGISLFYLQWLPLILGNIKCTCGIVGGGLALSVMTHYLYSFTEVSLKPLNG